MQNCSIWIPTRAVAKNSSLKFIKGSHKWNKWFVPRLFRTNENYADVKELAKHDNQIDDIENLMSNTNDDHEILQWKLEVLIPIKFPRVLRVLRVILQDSKASILFL